MESVLKENDCLLKHALCVDIVNIVVNDCMNVNCLTVDACEQCVTTESELKTDFIKKENYEMLLKQYNTLEKHCISLELNNQLNTEIFQRDNVSSSKSALNFAELFENNELKAQIEEKDTVILKLKKKIKSLRADDKESKVKDIETQNLELDHRVKENQEKDKIGSKPDKNRKRGEAGKSLKQLQWVEEEKLSKTQKEWPKTQTQSKAIQVLKRKKKRKG
nr:hypothetical protein [Tanacetum cinerariifolium]